MKALGQLSQLTAYFRNFDLKTIARSFLEYPVFFDTHFFQSGET